MRWLPCGACRMACRCLWDADTDNYAQDVYMSVSFSPISESRGANFVPGLKRVSHSLCCTCLPHTTLTLQHKVTCWRVWFRKRHEWVCWSNCRTLSSALPLCTASSTISFSLASLPNPSGFRFVSHRSDALNPHKGESNCFTSEEAALAPHQLLFFIQHIFTTSAFPSVSVLVQTRSA
jgi:hypothetical protein